MIKVNYKGNSFEYKVWIHPDNNAYFVELTDETYAPIEIIKDALENFYDIKIQSFCENGHKSYEVDNYTESNKFTYYFAIKDK